MTTRRAIIALLTITPTLLSACRSDSSSTVDAKPSDGATHPDSGSGSGSGSGSLTCAVYTDSTIAAMRMGTHSGCFKLTGVVTLGTTPSTKSPRLFVQDAAGGDFSAMMTRCSSTSTAHPCSVASTVAGTPDGHAVTLAGTYIKTGSTTFEEFFIDSISDTGAATAPAPATATLAEIERGGSSQNLRFQHVTVTIGAADTLQMYDWTPSELSNSSATACPYQFGFGMLPKSVTATKGGACASGTAQPPGQTAPNPAEVLIGTDFFKGFTVSSDCRCAKMFSDQEPAVASTLGGTIGGLLVFDVPFGTTTGYNYLAPKVVADAPITGTVAGM